MKLRIKTITYLFLLLYSYSYGQIDEYKYKRELKGISDQWHKIVLPDDLFGKINKSLSDIRIFGVFENNDTIEAPYLFRLTEEKISSRKVEFEILNLSKNDKGYYFTFEIPTNESINQIELDFNKQNFDWRIKLEGSQNQNEWFTIIDSYRILSIKNELTDFQFTKLTFPKCKYRFFRMLIDSNEKPDVKVASIELHEASNGTFKKHLIEKINIQENKHYKNTEIDVELQNPVPLSKISIGVKDVYDYYRPVTIKYVVDSFKTENGYKYSYGTLASGTLSSQKENEFKFTSTILDRLKILIHNRDNQSLVIDTINLNGYIYELTARFTEPAKYFLVYGNKAADRPLYDIDRFSDKIPEKPAMLELGEEQIIEKDEKKSEGPLFKNVMWMWIILTIIILLLGWFSIKMIKKT